MSAAATTAEQGATGAAGAPKPRGKRKRLLLAVPLVLALAGGGAWFAGLPQRVLGLERAEPKGEAAGAPAPAPASAAVFFDMPEIIANLNGNPRRPSYIKLRAKLELSRAEDAAAVQAAMPRLLDLFQTYLREMRPEDLRGAAGTYRLREELIARGTLAAAPARIVNVLFTEMLVQ
jgi:flagellar FliL protein